MKSMQSVRNPNVLITVEWRAVDGEPSLLFCAFDQCTGRNLEVVEVVPRGGSVGWVYRLMERAAAYQRHIDERVDAFFGRGSGERYSRLIDYVSNYKRQIDGLAEIFLGNAGRTA